MGLFGTVYSKKEMYDYNRLREDLCREYACRSAGYSSDFGFLQLCKAEKASNDELLRMARREGFDLSQYRR